jgi:hypothetical protein
MNCVDPQDYESAHGGLEKHYAAFLSNISIRNSSCLFNIRVRPIKGGGRRTACGSLAEFRTTGDEVRGEATHPPTRSVSSKREELLSEGVSRCVYVTGRHGASALFNPGVLSLTSIMRTQAGYQARAPESLECPLNRWFAGLPVFPRYGGLPPPLRGAGLAFAALMNP